jgi:hypothetical protein
MIRFLENNGDYLDIDDNKYYIYFCDNESVTILNEKEYKVISLISNIKKTKLSVKNPIFLIFKNEQDINDIITNLGRYRIIRNKIIDAIVTFDVLILPKKINVKNKHIIKNGKIYHLA